MLEPLTDYIMLLGVGVAVGCLLEGEKMTSVKEQLHKTFFYNASFNEKYMVLHASNVSMSSSALDLQEPCVLSVYPCWLH